MKVKPNQLTFVPVALIIGGSLFAFGYSLRPSRAQTQTETQIQTENTNAKLNVVKAGAKALDADASDSREVVTTRAASVAAVGALAAMPAVQEVAELDQAQIRSGIIVSMNGELFILRDDEHNTWYHLDDQKTAGSFLGKKVKVTGEVDPATDVIHVQSIEESKA